MNSFTLIFKNITRRWWRSFLLGSFVFIISALMVLFTSFSDSIRNTADDIIINGFTGHIQIRSDKSFEDDMVAQYNKGWDSLSPVPAALYNHIKNIIMHDSSVLQIAGRIRQTADLSGKNKQEESMIIGIDPLDTEYQSAFILKTGHFLSGSMHELKTGTFPEIILTSEQSHKLNIRLGDTIAISAKNKQGRNTRIQAAVTGIGDFILLSMFSYKACIMDRNTVQNMLGFEKDEFTEILIVLPDKAESGQTAENLQKLFTQNKIESEVTTNNKMTSDDIKITSMDSLRPAGENESIKISVFSEMGEIFRNAGNIVSTSFSFLMVLLLIITSMLIFNLVTLIGLERNREIGTLRAFGFSGARVLGMIMLELSAITVLFSTIGIILASIFILLFGSNIPAPIPALAFFMGETISLSPNPLFMISGFILIFIFTFTASILPLAGSCRISPRELLRGDNR